MMKRFCLLSLACLLSVVSSHARLALDKAFVPKTKTHVIAKEQRKKFLELRGGAGPIDPLTMAKVATVVTGAQGVVGSVSPSFMNEKYGVESNAVNDWIMQCFATGIASVATAAYCLLFKETSFATAFQFSLIPWVIQNLGTVLSKKASAAGFDDRGQTFCLLLNSFMIYGATQDWADTVYKVFSGWWLLNGVYMVVSPTNAASLWGNDSLDEGVAAMLMRLMGFYLTAASVMIGSISVFDKDALTAFGYVEVVWLMLHLVVKFATGEVEKFGIPEGPMYAWTLFHAVAAATILL